jgi:hypothetical protein
MPRAFSGTDHRRTVLRQAGVLASAVAALQAAGNLAFVLRRSRCGSRPATPCRFR